MAGSVGEDGFGDRAVENLAHNGVNASLVVRAAEPTGCAFITVDGSGENAITVASGANMSARAADLPAAFFAADTVLVLQMEVPFAQSLEAARRTKAASRRRDLECGAGSGQDDRRYGSRHARDDGLSRRQ